MSTTASHTDEIRTYIRDLVVELLECEPEEVTDSASFADDLELDSLTAIEMLVLIDKKYDIDISEERFREIENLNDAVDLVSEYLARQDGAAA